VGEKALRKVKATTSTDQITTTRECGPGRERIVKKKLITPAKGRKTILREKQKGGGGNIDKSKKNVSDFRMGKTGR